MTTRKLFTTLVFIGCAFFGAEGRASVMLNIDPGNNQLLGASGIEVNGTLYDVAFVQGSCQSVFSGCDEPGDFTFTTSADTETAMTALMNQVFAPNLLYDTNPELTFGISNTNEGVLVTPWETTTQFYTAVFFHNFTLAVGQVPFLFGQPDAVKINLIDPVDIDSGTRDFLVYAVWSETPLVTQGVPLPATMLLLLAGLAGAGFVRRMHHKP